MLETISYFELKNVLSKVWIIYLVFSKHIQLIKIENIC